MGKKFMKTNRHKKLKAVDPFYTGDRKLLIDKGLILANQAPSSKDLDTSNEKLPMKLRELIELKEKFSSVKSKKRAKQLLLANKPDERGAEVPLRPVPEFKKLDHESEEKFLNRIDKEVGTVIQRSQYENQFDVKIETQNENVVVKKEKKMSERKRKALNKLKEKLKFKKMNQKYENENKQIKHTNDVKFGEVAHQPPMITSFPRRPKSNGDKLTIPANKPTKSGVTEKDRNDVIYRYRMMKSHGKFK